MSEQSQTATTATADQGSRPDDSEPTPERQAELRAAYEANVAAGKAPYAGEEIRTRGELRWVMRERRWSGEMALPAGYQKADLSMAGLSGANLSGEVLVYADLSGADLSGANLSRAVLWHANLSRAVLFDANLTGGKPPKRRPGRGVPRQCPHGCRDPLGRCSHR